MIDIYSHLKEVEKRFREVEQLLQKPEVSGDPEKLKVQGRIHRELSNIINKYTQLKEAKQKFEEARELLEDSDPEIAAMAQEEYEEAEQRVTELESEIQVLLLPRDPLDEKNIIIEIRAGTGGEEAALFVADLFRLYSRYAEERKWKIELLSSSETNLGGFKEIIFAVEGDMVYSRMKYESGTHRVQRVPETEASGRLHTSAVTVAVLPEAEEIDVHINPDDLRVDVFRASGHGGQHVNVTDSAVRITHQPTGLVVSCQDEKSQHKNKAKALKVLRARLYDMEQQKQQDARTEARRKQVGSGDRSERIRTYNFPQNRLSDHRINLTLYSLDRILQGDMEEIIQRLILEEQTQRLKAL